MDQFTRRLIGFGVNAGEIDGIALCRMFNKAISGMENPMYLSTDHDPLCQYHRCQANLLILEVEEINSIPYAPLSHPFIERLIGTLRRELLDHLHFWNISDLEKKFQEFRDFYNYLRAHVLRGGDMPSQISGEAVINRTDLHQFRWHTHCRGLFRLPIAA